MRVMTKNDLDHNIEECKKKGSLSARNSVVFYNNPAVNFDFVTMSNVVCEERDPNISPYNQTSLLHHLWQSNRKLA
jgi:hypothetical protein